MEKRSNKWKVNFLKKLHRMRATGDFKVFFFVSKCCMLHGQSLRRNVKYLFSELLIHWSTHSVEYSFNEVLIQWSTHSFSEVLMLQWSTHTVKYSFSEFLIQSSTHSVKNSLSEVFFFLRSPSLLKMTSRGVNASSCGAAGVLARCGTSSCRCRSNGSLGCVFGSVRAQAHLLISFQL